MGLTVKGRSDTTQLAANRRFGQYKDEKEQAVRKAEVKTNPVFDKLKSTLIDIEYEDMDIESDRDLSSDLNYQAMVERTKMIVCTAEDIENFSIMLAELQDEKDFYEKAGLFLSALINNGSDEDYVIHTGHLSADMRDLGFSNTKNVIIKGDAGNLVGRYMQGGSITVKGNVGYELGQNMEDGSITVEGDADSEVGHWMKGGTITIEGNAGNEVGRWMKGGEIHLLGDYDGIANNFTGGKIYHKEKLVRPSLWHRFVDWIKSK